VKTYFYRYEGDAYETEYTGGIRATVNLTRYVGVKQTHAGWWVMPEYTSRIILNTIEGGLSPRNAGAKWISNTSRKRYAYPTKDEAWDSFCIRRSRRIEHLERQLRYAKAIEKIIEPDGEFKEECSLSKLISL